MSDPYQPQQSDPYQPQQNQPYQPQQPQQPQQNQPMPYGQSYPPVAMEHPQGTTVLVLGIVGIFVPIVSFVAWFMGNKVMKEIRGSGQTYSNEQNVNIGRILGMVFSILYIIAIVFSIIATIIFFVALGASSSR